MKGFRASDYSFSPTGVHFTTSDTELLQTYQIAEKYLNENEVMYNDKRVIKEGAEYPYIWLETQPMAGEMYAKRNIEVGLNNILYFLQYQRKDGRFPGMISKINGQVVGNYDWIQGFYFAQPALKMWYIIEKNTDYLNKLYHALEDFDDYLWTYRDSNGNGCLEIWCVWDTAEDNCTRLLSLGSGLDHFGGEKSPRGIGKWPCDSMEYMAYSYACRDTLSKISKLLNMGKDAYWQERAQDVRNKLISHLWDPDRYACFDRNCDGETIDCLTHVNFRCMYHGIFTQKMADDFLYYHLLNPDEFWTPYPLTATAIHDRFFLNDPKNNWSGPCQGLIYQRSIAAFHNYGHYAEALAVARKVLELSCKSRVFHQQYDPFTGEPGIGGDGYGPMIFAFMEYLSFLQGVNISMDEVHWSNALGCSDSEYTQIMFRKQYTAKRDAEVLYAAINGEEKFSISAGLRAVTDLDGNIQNIICVDEVTKGFVKIGETVFSGSVEPNEIYECCENTFVKVGGARYFKPGTIPVAPYK